VESAGQVAQEPADGQAEVVTAAGLLAAPERDHRRHACRRRDDDPIGLDPLQAPDIGAQGKGVADAALVDELLIQLADADAAGGVGGVLPGVGDGAAADEGKLAAAGQGEQTVVDPIPADPRLQRCQGRWTLDVGRWTFNVGPWTLDFGCWTREAIAPTDH